MDTSFKYALKHSIPVFVGFVPVALAYGVLMSSAGYNFIWTGATSLIVLAGSLQYLMVSFFTGTVSLGTVAVMALLLNSRHIFYGIPFIERFRKCGPWKFFLIYSLADEVFSLDCSLELPEGASEKKVFIWTGVLVSQFWVWMTVIGGLLGSLIRFDTAGIDFAMTALFIVILLDQLRDAKSGLPAVLALASGLLCLLVIGADSFILPSLCITVTLLLAFRGRLEEKSAGTEEIPQQREEKA